MEVCAVDLYGLRTFFIVTGKEISNMHGALPFICAILSDYVTWSV